ncbi:MAG: hypothetical protein FWE76_08255 [Symbiobacteriaceae bacterium]|nr:hypothetical protein [Symbiobacteriaceae bacterium]
MRFLRTVLVVAFLCTVLELYTLPVKAYATSFILPVTADVAEGSIPVSSREELESIRDDLDGRYHLIADIILSGAEWIPIGDATNPFTGSLNGNGYCLVGMNITTSYFCSGLFGFLSGAAVTNLGLTDILIDNRFCEMSADAGGISATTESSIINNCFVTGAITFTSIPSINVGGIVGYSYNSTINYCFSEVTIRIHAGERNVNAGGICGSSSQIDISDCYNIGSVSATARNPENMVGGICGGGAQTYISRCYNSGQIDATSPSFAIAGGISGSSWGKTENCYNSGKITATAFSVCAGAGGISGGIGDIEGCYNSGDISASSGSRDYPGALIGYYAQNNHIKNSYWSIYSRYVMNGERVSASATDERNTVMIDSFPLNHDQMQQAASFSGFSFGSIWEFRADENFGYPVLVALPHRWLQGQEISYPSEPPPKALQYTPGADNGQTVTALALASAIAYQIIQRRKRSHATAQDTTMELKG